MAVGLSLGALLLGAMADRLRKLNIRTEVLLAGVGALFIVAELALVLRIPLPSLLPWPIVSIAGAATVLSFAVIADYFPKEFAARANGALNLLHFGWAFTSNGRLRTDIIRSRPIRPHSVFALRFRPPRWCGLRSPGFGRSANTSTSFSRRRLRSVTAKSHWSRCRSTELSLRRMRDWNGDTGVSHKFK